MSKRIEEIMRISQNGYIEEYDDIEVILEHFLNYSMEELNNVLPKNYKILNFAADVAVKLGNINITDSSQIEKIKLSELLCIMKYYEKNYDDSEEILLSYMKLLRNNIACLNSLPWAMLFISISVKSLMDFFYEKTDNREYFKAYRDIFELSGQYAEYGISALTTVRQLLDGTAGALFASWNPCYNKDEYFAQIENCCRILKRLFIDGIAAYYREKFNFFEFMNKYGLEISFPEGGDTEKIFF